MRSCKSCGRVLSILVPENETQCGMCKQQYPDPVRPKKGDGSKEELDSFVDTQIKKRRWEMKKAELEIELERAYRCIQHLHNRIEHPNLKSCAEIADISSAYHAPTIAAAKKFVFEGELVGSNYFIGKHVSVMQAALALPVKEEDKGIG